MPKPRKNKLVNGIHFAWILSQRHGVWWADGRSNPIDVGRHSLGTKDRDEANRQLPKLDRSMAVKHSLADPEALLPMTGDELPLALGRQLYEAHVARPRVSGGARASSQKRYRAVLDKLLKFLAKQGITCWNGVTVNILNAYLAHLEAANYAYGTQYLEGTTVKQIVTFLIAEKRLPATARIALKLRKPQGTGTYCWTKSEVVAILKHTGEKTELRWLHELLATLAYTGMRIGEAISLRWGNLDLDSGLIKIVDDSTSGRAKGRSGQTTNKGGRNRSFPIHIELGPILANIPRQNDGLIFHGPLGGRLKADTVRNIFIRDVLEPLGERFPTLVGKIGFADGRLHSFRHFFCSFCAIGGMAQQTVMNWLGHQDSKLIQHYFHLNDGESRKQMGKLTLMDIPSGNPSGF